MHDTLWDLGEARAERKPAADFQAFVEASPALPHEHRHVEADGDQIQTQVIPDDVAATTDRVTIIRHKQNFHLEQCNAA